MTSSEVIKTIKNRRSVRSYIDDQIPDDDLYHILESGLYAPSGKDRQPWRFVVIRNSDAMKAIAKITVYSRFIRNAPVMILVFVKVNAEYSLEKDMIGIGACLQNILLTATSKGYGSCIIGELYNQQIDISECTGAECSNYLLVCGIVIGKAKSAPKDIDKRMLENFILGTIQ